MAKGEEFIIHRWGLERKKRPHERDTLFQTYNVDKMETRVCKKCGKPKSIEDFELYITPAGKRHQRWECKDCRREYHNQRNYIKGLLLCPVCDVKKPKKQFVRENSLDFKVYGKICRECTYKKNITLRESKSKKEKQVHTKREVNDEYRKRYRETKERLIDYFGNKCAVCNRSFDWYAYDFHHKEGSDKEAKISRFIRNSWNHIKELPEFWKELAKCDLVCAICHRKLHLNGGT